MKMVSTSVRTPGWRAAHRQPSSTSVRRRVVTAAGGRTGRAIRVISTAPTPTSTAWPRNGTATPAAKSAAPSAGPASWLSVTTPVRTRELARMRSSRLTRDGSIEVDAVSLNTSAVPRTKRAARVTVMFTHPVRMAVARITRTAARASSTAAESAALSTRSATAPLNSPNSSHGRRWRSSAKATRLGLWVWEATSRGPAATAKPSPRLAAHEEATSHRNPEPKRAGRSRSTIPSVDSTSRRDR